jgi:hypothetical protein
MPASGRFLLDTNTNLGEARGVTGTQPGVIAGDDLFCRQFPIEC